MSIIRTIVEALSRRAIADLLLIALAFLFPWWLSVLVACVFFFIFDRFIELLLVAFLIDLLYGAPLSSLADSKFALSMGATLLYFLFTAIKSRMRF